MKKQSLKERTRERMIDGVNTATGRGDCAEVAVLQQRQSWVVAACAGLVFLVMLFLNTQLELGSLINGAIAGIAIAVPLTLLTTNFWLGYCDGTVVLVSVSKFSSKAVATVGEWPYPVQASIGRGWLIKKVKLCGSDYLLAKQFEDRFRAITGSA